MALVRLEVVMKTLILLITIIGIKLNAETYIGVNQGHHILSVGLNDTHPYIGYNFDNYGTVFYNNSYNTPSIAGYIDFNNNGDQLLVSAKVGLTSGYRKYMTYKGKHYDLSFIPFINDNIMLFILPSVSIVNGQHSYDLSVMGESVNLGITYNF